MAHLKKLPKKEIDAACRLGQTSLPFYITMFLWMAYTIRDGPRKTRMACRLHVQATSRAAASRNFHSLKVTSLTLLHLDTVFRPAYHIVFISHMFRGTHAVHIYYCVHELTWLLASYLKWYNSTFNKLKG